MVKKAKKETKEAKEPKAAKKSTKKSKKDSAVAVQPSINIGLIGHVDHGKTNLVKALS